MKLYTESEIISAYEKAELCHLRMESFIELITPIELPSDEEIIDLGPFKSTLPYNVVFYNGWLEGATLIRNLIIKRGNNDQ